MICFDRHLGLQTFADLRSYFPYRWGDYSAQTLLQGPKIVILTGHFHPGDFPQAKMKKPDARPRWLFFQKALTGRLEQIPSCRL
jgi:hypothetical protein